MDGACDQLFTGARLAENQDRRVRGPYGFNLLQGTLQNRALTHDFAEVVFGTQFLFEVNFLFSQPVSQFSDLAKSYGVIERESHLFRCLAEQPDLFGIVCILSLAPDHQGSQHSVMAYQRQPASRFDAARFNAN